MDPNLVVGVDFKRMQQLLLAARELPPAERAAWLTRACGGDTQLRAEIESLLSHDQDDLVVLSPGFAGEALARNLESGSVPERIGPYRLLDILGEGGMGVVYRARQEQPLPRDVALKLLRFGMNTPSARLRFDLERSILARMQHPGIAKVFDAGDWEGRPWVAMELVHGQAITTWCDAQRSTVQERVGLMRQVCEALQHAHQKGVVHRDLKPSNLLVDDSEGQPRVRIIDFGIAKGLDDTGAGARTLAGELIGTPQYMSPEQAGGGVLAVDTRSDLYSLGVVLHELLVGDTPIGKKTLSERGLAETLRYVREREVVLPSQKFRSLEAAEQDVVAAARSSRPAALLHDLRGDLDAVITHALELEPSRRYNAVSELSDELGRWLRREPVEAALPGPRRRLVASIRRHPAVSAAIATGFIALLAGLTTTLWQASRVDHQRAVAEARLEDIRRFMIDFVFELDTQIGRVAGTTEVRRYLGQETVDQLGRIAADETARARLRLPLASAHRKLSRLQKELGDLDAALASLDTAEQLAQEELAQVEKSIETRRELAVILDSKATIFDLRGDDERALAATEAALREFEQLAREDPSGETVQTDLNTVRASLAGKLRAVGRLDEARRMREITIEGRRNYVREHPEDALELSRLGREVRRLAEYWEDESDTERSDPLYEEMLSLHRRAYELEPGTAQIEQEFALALHAAGRHRCVMGNIDAGLALLWEAARLKERILAEDPRRLRFIDSLLGTLSTIGETEYDRANYDVALRCYQRADSLGNVLVDASPEIILGRNRSAWTKQLLGRVNMRMHRFNRSESSFRAGLACLDSLADSGDLNSHWRRASIECDLGDMNSLQASQSRGAQSLPSWQAAKSWYERGIGTMRAMQGDGTLAQWQVDEIAWRLRSATGPDSALVLLAGQR